jgi:hypothetical protein
MIRMDRAPPPELGSVPGSIGQSPDPSRLKIQIQSRPPMNSGSQTQRNVHRCRSTEKLTQMILAAKVVR